MKPEAQNIAIAAAIGRQWHKPTEAEIDSGSYYSYWPDFTSDLNVMNFAISSLASDGSWTRFLAELENALNCAGQPSTTYQMMMVNASAGKRAEAFLRAIGKWEDSA